MHVGCCSKSVANWMIKHILHCIRKDLTNPYESKKDGLSFLIEAVFYLAKCSKIAGVGYSSIR